MAMRPPPPEAPPVFWPPSAWISPAPLIVVASMRMLPPAALPSLDSPFARILPSITNGPVLIRATPPPVRHGEQLAFVVPAPAPPGSFGSNGEPYAAGTLPR